MDAALQDRKEGLGTPHSFFLVALERHYTSFQPSHTSLARFTRERNLSLPGHHVVELHDDVGAECTLEGDHALRREEPAGSIDVTSEFDAVLADRAERLQREHLEPARVGENRAVPLHEAMQPADLPNGLLP